MTIIEEQVRSRNSQESLAKMDDWLKSSSGSRWIRLQAGETFILTFDETRVNTITRDFGDGRKVPRAEYNVLTERGEEKTIEFSRTWAEQIQNLLKKGHRRLEVKRQGIGKDTRYFFLPAS
jgi:hypothetical protein